MVSNIRSDHILWINENLEYRTTTYSSFKRPRTRIQSGIFLGIQDVEAHFACYNAGEFYALHRDNPQGKNGRVDFSGLLFA